MSDSTLPIIIEGGAKNRGLKITSKYTTKPFSIKKMMSTMRNTAVDEEEDLNMTNQKMKVINAIPESLLSLFGGASKFLTTYEWIEWKPEYNGYTDYIDRLDYSALHDNSIGFGMDHFRRPFIVIETTLPNGTPKHDVLFQRYTDETLWACINGYLCPDSSAIYNEKRGFYESIPTDEIEMLVSTGQCNHVYRHWNSETNEYETQTELVSLSPP